MDTLAVVGVLAVVAILLTARSLGHDPSAARGRGTGAAAAFVLALLVHGLAPFAADLQAAEVLAAVGHVLLAAGLWIAFRTALLVLSPPR